MEILIEKILNSFQNSIPLAHIICFVPLKSIKSKIVSILKKFSIEIITIPNSNGIIANRRFIESFKFLKKKNIFMKEFYL